MANKLMPVASRTLKGADDLWQFFETWRETRPSRSELSTSIRFGSGHIELVSSGAELAKICAEALPIERGQAGSQTHFEIYVIDGAESGLPLPKLGWSPSDFGPKRRVPGWSDAAKTTYLLRTEKGVAVADWLARRAFVWIPSHETLPWWERAAPLRWLLDGVAESWGWLSLHAAVVGTQGRGILIGGPSGAGKSTLALACLARGMEFVGDDYCLLMPGDVSVCANLFTTAKLDETSPMLEPLAGEVKPRSIDKSGEKAIFFLRPHQLLSRIPVDAIALPQFSRQAHVEEVSPIKAMQQIAPSTIALSEADGGFVVRTVAALVRSVPSFRFKAPPDLERCANMISAMVTT